MIFYHGTAATYLAAIKAKGLIPHGSRGADTFAKETLRWSDRVMAEIEDRPTSVFVTTHKHIADWYARMTAISAGSKPAIVKLEIPDTELHKLKIDEEGTSGADPTTNAFGGRWEGSIPPSWIKGRAKLETHPDPVPSHGDAIMLGYADE